MTPWLAGQILGATIAMALFGALFAWIVRKLTTATVPESYAIGIPIAVFLGSYAYTLGSEGTPYFAALALYSTGGVLAFPLMILTGKRKQ